MTVPSALVRESEFRKDFTKSLQSPNDSLGGHSRKLAFSGAERQLDGLQFQTTAACHSAVAANTHEAESVLSTEHGH